MGFFLQLIPRRIPARPPQPEVRRLAKLPIAPAYDPVRAQFERESG